jgi:hypothetical protein
MAACSSNKNYAAACGSATWTKTVKKEAAHNILKRPEAVLRSQSHSISVEPEP